MHLLDDGLGQGARHVLRPVAQRLGRGLREPREGLQRRPRLLSGCISGGDLPRGRRAVLCRSTWPAACGAVENLSGKERLDVASGAPDCIGLM